LIGAFHIVYANNSLVIQLKNGKTIEYKNIQFNVNYRIYEEWNEIGFIVVEKAKRNGELVSYIIVDVFTGEEQVIKGTPYLSPDKKNFAYSICEPDANYNEDTFGVYTINQRKIELFQEINLDRGWCASTLKWENRNKLTFSKTYLDMTQENFIEMKRSVLEYDSNTSSWIIWDEPNVPNNRFQMITK
jgi:hypothetical protein